MGVAESCHERQGGPPYREGNEVETYEHYKCLPSFVRWLRFNHPLSSVFHVPDDHSHARAPLHTQDETAQKCIKFMASLDDIDHFTEAEKEKIVEQIMVACLGPLGKATKAAGCFKKKTAPPPETDKEDKEPENAA